MKVKFLLVIVVLAALLAGCGQSATATATPAATATATASPTATPAATPTPTAVPISHVYAFGDSFSDNGNLKQLMPSGDSWRIYWEGRCSNGPTAVEVLAARLNVELDNYAVSGAKSDTSNVNPVPNTGYLGQIEKFKTELKGQSADPNALYFVWIGANDFVEKVSYNAPIDNPTLTDDVVNNIATGVTQLAQLGARRFLVITCGEIAAMPGMIALERSDQAAEFQALVTSKLTDRLDELTSQLQVEITVFDHLALSAEIRENPSDYGLTNVSDACQPRYFGVKPACDTPDQYYFWDELPPTRRAHQIFGEAWAALFGK